MIGLHHNNGKKWPLGLMEEEVKKLECVCWQLGLNLG
jgi:hypothetical protein